jgi:hypothetical protein
MLFQTASKRLNINVLPYYEPRSTAQRVVTDLNIAAYKGT